MATEKWNSKLMFPTMADAVNRIAGTDFGPSNSSGNPMVTCHLEVHSPQTVEIDGKQVTIAGVKSKKYYTTTVFEEVDGQKVVNKEKTEKSRDNLKKLLAALKLPTENINWDNFPHASLRGKLVFCMMEPDVVEKRANPTAEELKKDKNAEGKILRHPVTKQPLVDYWPRTTEIWTEGVPAQDGANVPY